MNTSFFLCSLFLCCSFWAIGQKSEIIYLTNASFEDAPRAGWAPRGWIDCGHAGESPPDVQPNGGFRVTKAAYEGSTYIGLVTRDNNTWERVAQRLTNPIKGGECYNFSLHLARSDTYISSTKKNPNDLVNFERGVTIRIWGGNSSCSYEQLLATSPEVKHFDWRSYSFKLNPTKDYNYICIEAYYKKPTMFPYNGNILVDNASEISSCDIPIEEPPGPDIIAKVDPDKTPKPDKRINERPDPNDKKDPPVDPDPKTENTTVQETNKGSFSSDIKASELEVGDILQVENLYFPADESIITNNSERVLLQLVYFLKKYPNISIEIGGHTNMLPPPAYCDKLSNARAKNVAQYLVKNGIAEKRITYKGYGKNKPLDESGTNLAKKRNQRVEVKITGK
ncbi:MAG: OmpA family protein [Saprospiraceae bacterium]|nr:OmpA family protein [Saprospiraceae bacterium]